MEDLKQCEVCKERLPEVLVNSFWSYNKYYLCCPECVLKIRGETSFTGGIAQSLLEKQREWVRKRGVK